MRRFSFVLVLGLVLGLVGPAATSQEAVNPVTNPGFELALENPASEALEGSALDECIGVGHQVLYGNETWQHKLVDDGDPAAAAEQIADDPGGEAEFFAGYGHCVFSDEEGQDAAWLNLVDLSQDDAVQWSGHDDDLVGDLDGDGDREIGVSADGGHHNLWQAWSNPFQAFTGNFEALEFNIEGGTVADGAKVIISFSTTPQQTQHPFAGLFLECQISFGADLLVPDGSGQVSADPTDATFGSRDDRCDDAKAEWDAADDAGKRDVLGRLRLVQLSFWGFEQADEDPDCGCTIQIDDVSLTNATSVVEEVAGGNLNVNPDLDLE